MTSLFVRKSIVIGAPASEIWTIIVTPERWKEWTSGGPTLEGGQRVELGSKVLWSDRDGRPYLMGTVVGLEPSKELILELADATWTRCARSRGMLYSMRLSPEGDATRVDVSLLDEPSVNLGRSASTTRATGAADRPVDRAPQ